MDVGLSTLLRLPYKFVQKCAGAAGFELSVVRKGKKSGSHEPVRPKATFAPWLADTAFTEVYEAVKGNTLVDKYRCYELWQLVAECGEVPGALMEVGVWRGGSGCLIAKRARMLGIEDTVYLCDTFSGVVKAGKNDNRYRGGEHADASMEAVTALTKSLGLEKVRVLRGMFPEATADAISDDIFRFCHIDVDVYQSAKDVVEWIWPKLSVGGMIVFDDYGFRACEGITRYIEGERGKRDRAVVHNLNGHAIIIKRS